MTAAAAGAGTSSRALGEFSFFSCFLYIFINVYCIYRFLSTKYATWKVVTTRTGSNDVRRVV